MAKQQITLFMNNLRYEMVEGESTTISNWKHDRLVIDKSTVLPRVLLSPIAGDSIAMFRALKQVEDLLLNNIYDPTTNDKDQAAFHDRVNASLDDIRTMLATIK